MNPLLYYGNDPQQFAPCDAVLTGNLESIKRHPATLAIRNKRKRMRLVRKYARFGIKSFMRPVWEITPTKPEQP